MKRKIRSEVFETNSSATATLWVKKKMSKNKLKMKDGYVLADFGKFDTEEKVYTSQNDKLSFLLSELYYINGWDTSDIENMYQFDYLVKAIQNYDDSVIGIKILNKKTPDLDHQIQPEFNESRFVNYWDKGSIQNFLFNNNVGIETGCD